ncbi:peptidoglycan editing factor PgeF [Aquibacillus halophilus]|uniref:Purine nucleoside phosphorylase n=1 Tax=Aquibacillus halophilus TaxID=930132 RepID=A0A6A8DH01_9BACI|nr:peptidoglycan editing factor PgeF [Aquibacillus halophilus]MRH42177.1 peptidoglycan editing factor PgeF [Aquibacillus halophilus]
MEHFQKAEDSVLMIEKWVQMEPTLKVGFTTRSGGVSSSPFNSMNMGLHVADNYDDVLTNRTVLSDIINIPLDNWVMGEQVHGTDIVVIDQNHAGRGARTDQDALEGIDGIITNHTNILCTAFFADCVPLFFFDPKTKWIGVAHAGWRGTVDQMAMKMVNKLIEVGVNTRDLMVAIGPCISKLNYEVDDRVISNVPDQLKEKVVTRNEHGFLLDLQQLNKEYLVEAGILEENISVTNYCTYNDKEMFFSHRRDHGKTGRMLGFIGFSQEL